MNLLEIEQNFSTSENFVTICIRKLRKIVNHVLNYVVHPIALIRADKREILRDEVF